MVGWIDPSFQAGLKKLKNEKKKKLELEQKFGEVVRRLFGTPDGVYFCREIVKQVGLFDYRDSFRDDKDRIAQDAMQRIYTRFIRQYLEDDTIHKIERKIP